jgi:hypothetical protein
MRLASALLAREQGIALLLALTACGTTGGTAEETSTEPSAKTSTSRHERARSSSSAPVETAPPASTGGVLPADATGGGVDREKFCERASKLSELNLGKCTRAEQDNLPAPELDAVKPMDQITRECAARVGSAKARYDPKAGQRCIDAAEKRGGLMTFYRFSEIPECRGVVTGIAAEGQPVLYAEECAPGLAWVENRCAKQGAKNAECARGTAGILGAPAQHVACEPGLACLYTRYPYEGDAGELRCLEPTSIGGACRLRGRDPRLTNLCPSGTSCYQGKCRALAEEGGECMSWDDCGPRSSCVIEGGVFGKCSPPAPERCLAQSAP